MSSATNDQRPTTIHRLLYYITDRKPFAADERTRRRRLLEKIGEAVRANIDYIQLREKDLGGRELESLAREAVTVVQKLRTENRELRTALLINSRIDVALAVAADGVHLRSDDITPKEVADLWGNSHPSGGGRLARASSQTPIIGISCHTPKEVSQAAKEHATFAVFAPVFEKKDAPGTLPAGLTKLHEACQAGIPVLALGGITQENAKSCLEAGASGIAAIRLFQENNIEEIATRLRNY